MNIRSSSVISICVLFSIAIALIAWHKPFSISEKYVCLNTGSIKGDVSKFDKELYNEFGKKYLIKSNLEKALTNFGFKYQNRWVLIEYKEYNLFSFLINTRRHDLFEDSNLEETFYKWDIVNYLDQKEIIYIYKLMVDNRRTEAYVSTSTFFEAKPVKDR